jgi:hypothetical protein
MPTDDEQRERAAREYTDTRGEFETDLDNVHIAGQLHGEPVGEAHERARIVAFGRQQLTRHRDDHRLQAMVGRFLDAIERGDHTKGEEDPSPAKVRPT